MIQKVHWYECRVANKKKSEKGSSRQKKKESRGLDSWQFYSVGSLC